jgi:xanthine dehydrogenase YagT iron-sulfur-binding subunit
MDHTLRINGTDHTLTLDPRDTLLDVLRDRLGLTGTKKGCDHGQCGACTVLSNGKRILSCLQLAATQRDEVTTIEGITSPDGSLHPMQAAFIRHDALQCGYCTPGQIMSAIACISEGHATGEDDIRSWMSGNLCRCASYPNIRAAILEAASTEGFSR